MKTKSGQQLTQNANPNGEGFDALPVSFNASTSLRARVVSSWAE